MASTQQAWENREYVRRLLRERQPGFAAALELAEQELRLDDRLERLRSASAVSRPRHLKIFSRGASRG
jgi:hypothetical protein